MNSTNFQKQTRMLILFLFYYYWVKGSWYFLDQDNAGFPIGRSMPKLPSGTLHSVMLSNENHAHMFPILHQVLHLILHLYTGKHMKWFESS